MKRILTDAAKLSDGRLRASWLFALDQLTEAIAVADARYAAVVTGLGDDDNPSGPPDQDDVDLAG